MIPDLPNLLAQLHRVQHFRQLPEADVRAIIMAGGVRRYAAGETICAEGEPCSGMFVLLRGRVHLEKLGPLGQRFIIAVIEPVIMFNEVAALDGGPNPATAVTTHDSLIWQVSCDHFQALLKQHPEISLGMIQVLARRNRLLVSQYADLSFRPVQARVAKMLLELSDAGRHPIDRRKHPNHEMAARIATVPEAFSRAPNTFRRSGCITTTRTTITVSCIEDLIALAAL